MVLQNTLFTVIPFHHLSDCDLYAHAACMDQCFVLFAGSVHMCNDAQSRLADIIYSSQTELAGCGE